MLLQLKLPDTRTIGIMTEVITILTDKYDANGTIPPSVLKNIKIVTGA